MSTDDPTAAASGPVWDWVATQPVGTPVDAERLAAELGLALDEVAAAVALLIASDAVHVRGRGDCQTNGQPPTRCSGAAALSGLSRLMLLPPFRTKPVPVRRLDATFQESELLAEIAHALLDLVVDPEPDPVLAHLANAYVATARRDCNARSSVELSLALCALATLGETTGDAIAAVGWYATDALQWAFLDEPGLPGLDPLHALLLLLLTSPVAILAPGLYAAQFGREPIIARWDGAEAWLTTVENHDGAPRFLERAMTPVELFAQIMQFPVRWKFGRFQVTSRGLVGLPGVDDINDTGGGSLRVDVGGTGTHAIELRINGPEIVCAARSLGLRPVTLDDRRLLPLLALGAGLALRHAVAPLAPDVLEALLQQIEAGADSVYDDLSMALLGKPCDAVPTHPLLRYVHFVLDCEARSVHRPGRVRRVRPGRARWTGRDVVMVRNPVGPMVRVTLFSVTSGGEAHRERITVAPGTAAEIAALLAASSCSPQRAAVLALIRNIRLYGHGEAHAHLLPEAAEMLGGIPVVTLAWLRLTAALRR